MNVNVQSKQS